MDHSLFTKFSRLEIEPETKRRMAVHLLRAYAYDLSEDTVRDMHEHGKDTGYWDKAMEAFPGRCNDLWEAAADLPIARAAARNIVLEGAFHFAMSNMPLLTPFFAHALGFMDGHPDAPFVPLIHGPNTAEVIPFHHIRPNWLRFEPGDECCPQGGIVEGRTNATFLMPIQQPYEGRSFMAAVGVYAEPPQVSRAEALVSAFRVIELNANFTMIATPAPGVTWPRITADHCNGMDEWRGLPFCGCGNYLDHAHVCPTCKADLLEYPRSAAENPFGTGVFQNNAAPPVIDPIPPP